MTFEHEFCYFILLFSSLIKKEGKENENEVAKIVIKSHTFLFHPFEIIKHLFCFVVDVLKIVRKIRLKQNYVKVQVAFFYIEFEKNIL